MNPTDPHGYYEILEVSPKATTEEIRQAFRRRAKELHPDVNQDESAHVTFQFLNEAYATLIDHSHRAKYDQLNAKLNRPQIAHTTWRSTHITCAECGKVTPHPRHIRLFTVISFIVYPKINREEGISCRPCADSRALQANLFNYLCGFWGVGAFPTLYVLWLNLTGGYKPADKNAPLLFDQARAYAGYNEIDLAHDIAQDALGFAKKIKKGQPLVQEIQAFLAQLPPTEKKPVRAWTLLRPYVFFELFIFAFFVSLIWVVIYVAA